MLSKISALALLSTSVGAVPVQVEINGKMETKHVITTTGIANSGNDWWVLGHGQKMYIGDQDNVGGNAFWNPNLLGAWASIDIELESASCSCNAAWFLVSMPARDWNGNPQKCGYNDYYCDANDVGGCWCPEMDIMEANKYAFQTTPHRCDQVDPSNKHYNHCDGGGCATRHRAWTAAHARHA